MDTLDRNQRSRVMRSVRSHNNRSTEKRVRYSLVAKGVTGWTVGRRDILGWPDFYFEATKLAVFVDGCFWHGCSKCLRLPRTNRKYWLTKIEGNKRRDKHVTNCLRRSGTRVIRFWEHEVRDDLPSIIRAICKKL